MARAKVELTHGLQIGKKFHKTAILKESTTGDILDATEESEKVITLADGSHALVVSDAFLGINILRRQIVSVGEYEGSLTLQEMRHLHPNDLALLQVEADTLDNTAVSTVVNKKTIVPETRMRGRDEESGDGAD